MGERDGVTPSVASIGDALIVVARGQRDLLRDLRAVSPADPADPTSRSAVPRAGRPSPGSVVLRVDGLQKRYGTTEAVAGITFDIREAHDG